MSGELLDQELLMSQERPTQLHGQGDLADLSGRIMIRQMNNNI